MRRLKGPALFLYFLLGLFVFAYIDDLEHDNFVDHPMGDVPRQHISAWENAASSVIYLIHKPGGPYTGYYYRELIFFVITMGIALAIGLALRWKK